MANKEELDLYYDLVSKGYISGHTLKTTLDIQADEDKKLFEVLDAASYKEKEPTITHTGNSGFFTIGTNYMPNTLYIPGTYSTSSTYTTSDGSWEYTGLDGYGRVSRGPTGTIGLTYGVTDHRPARKPREIREYKCKK